MRRVHGTLKKHQCEECLKQGLGPRFFNAPSTLKRHIESVHLKLRLKCEFCEKTVPRDHMKKHIKAAHEGPNKLCDLCGEAFTDQKSLRIHRKEFCEKTVEHDLIKKHIKAAHEGPKKLCDLCGEGFTDQKSLRIHRKIHDGGFNTIFQTHLLDVMSSEVLAESEKKFACDKCDSGNYFSDLSAIIFKNVSNLETPN